MYGRPSTPLFCSSKCLYVITCHLVNFEYNDHALLCNYFRPMEFHLLPYSDVMLHQSAKICQPRVGAVGRQCNTASISHEARPVRFVIEYLYTASNKATNFVVP